MPEDRALRVAIVGSGPSGMYAAGHLLENAGGTFTSGRLVKRVNMPVEVDVIDRLPTPWGLIRGGVAPDHPDKKKMSRLYDAIAHRPGFRFIGNVAVGDAVKIEDLARWYDAVVYAVGADGERRLGIPGEDLAGSIPARRFVGWYNGHPDFSDLDPELDTDRAVIVGNGNVSMDVARILLKPVEALRRTDIAAHALDALAKSRIREVVILGRRGPEHAAFHFPELEELGELDDTEIVVEDCDAARSVLEAGADAGLKMRILKHLCTRNRRGSRRIVLRFHTIPVSLLGSDKVEGLKVASAAAASATESLETGLVLAAVGYRGRAIPGLPFDEARGVIPSQDGRVMVEGAVLPGAFVTGWIRRGPQGIIGSNKKCARDCVHTLIADAEAGALPRAGTLAADRALGEISARCPSLSTYSQWQAIDAHERREGARISRPRLKLTRFDEVLAG